MFRSFLFLLLFVGLYNCKEKEPKSESKSHTSSQVSPLTADEIINKAIEVAGGPFISHSEITFDFRDIHYKAVRHYGKFELSRQYKESGSEIADVLNNSGFERVVDGKPVVLADSIAAKYSASVNSVHYFSILPYGLDGKAVLKESLGSATIKGNEYYKIKVSFAQDGGGEDHDDIYMYWVNKDTFAVDYLAYTYKEKSGQGYRFREAYNKRDVKGIRFVDYDNYKNKTPNIEFEAMDSLFSNDELELLSKIELKNIEVEILN